MYETIHLTKLTFGFFFVLLPRRASTMILTAAVCTPFMGHTCMISNDSGSPTHCQQCISSVEEFIEIIEIRDIYIISDMHVVKIQV